MRNLKKALSLVLALVFVLGLCTIGAGAAFTDADQIQYNEAITVLNGLGILEGYGDGKFGPLDNLTREQAAKMIAYMMLGEANAEKLINKQVFDDVAATRWSAKYIYFCYQKGIINGYGDGNFGPADNVTGTQLAKMLLCAAGYGCMGEYTGEGWDVNVFIDAVSEGIFEDAKTEDYSAIATREEAALYVFNALTELDQVAYDVDLNKYMGGYGTFAEEVWELLDTAEDEKVHVVAANQATGADYTIIDGVKYAIETGLDVIGHDVNVYFKDDPKKDAEGETYYEAYLVEDVSTVVTVGMEYLGEIGKALGYPETKFVDVPVWENYVKSSGTTLQNSFMKDTNDDMIPDTNTYTSFAKSEVGTANADYGYMSGLSMGAQLVLSAEGELISYLKTSSTVQKVTGIENGAITLNNGRTYYTADAAEAGDYVYAEAYEGIAKKDEVTLQPVGELYYIYPNSKMDISVFDINNIFGSYNYIYSRRQDCDFSVYSMTVGNTYEVSLDYYGSIYAAELKESGNGGYVLLIGVYTRETDDNVYEEKIETGYIQVVDSEGNVVLYPVYTAPYDKDKAEYDYSKLTAAQTATKKLTPYGVYLASIDDEGFATLSTAPFSGTTVKSPKGFGKDATVDAGYYLEDSTKYFYVNGEDSQVEVDAASYFSTEANQKVYYYGVQDGSSYSTSVVWVVGADAPVEVADSYIYVKADDAEKSLDSNAWGKTTVGGEVVPFFWMYVNGVAGYVNIDTVNSAGYALKNSIYGPADTVTQGFYRYTTDANNLTTLVALTSAEQVILTADFGLRNGKLTVGGTYNCDNVDVSELVVCDLSGSETANGYKRNISSVEAIEDLIGDGYTVEISYVAVEDANDDWAPVGAIYVTSVK